MSRQPTARSTAGTARSRMSTTRSKRSKGPEIELPPPPPPAIEKFANWASMVAKKVERTVLIIKPDVVEEHEDDIIQLAEDFCEMRNYEIVECSRIQLVKEKAMGYCLATQEARAVEDERLAKEEEERIRIEEENRRIEMEVATKARREARQARRDAGESDVEEDTVYGGNTNRSHLTTGRTGRTGKATGRTGGKKTNRTGGTTGRSGVATGRSGGRTGRTTGRSGGKTARQRAEALAETQRLLEEENERKLIIREKISSFLCGGEIVVMIIEGKDCVNGILELVGDDDVDYWPDFPDSLRSKYGTDSLRNAVESSIIPIAGHREAEYFKELLEERAMMDALLKSGKSKPAKKSHWVSMSNLLNFCFPKTDRHPLSTGRLSVFGNYGPLAEDGTLRGGRQGSRIVSHMELEAMIQEMQREDILQVYIGKQKLQREEQEEILKQADEELKNMKPLTPEDIIAMFRNCPINEKGEYSFHDMQIIIINERIRRLRQMCMMPCDRGAEKIMKILKRAMRLADKAGGNGNNGFIKKKWKARPPKPLPKISDQDTYRVNAILLNKNTFRITEVNNGNGNELTTNVKLLLSNRDKNQDTSSARNWDSTCCLRNTNKGTRVDTQRDVYMGVVTGPGRKRK